jgi:hypothetical protein
LTASDSDRERVLDMLKTAFVQGQLTKHEFDSRAGQALVAQTFGDLTALTADIVTSSVPRPVRMPAKTPSLPTHAVVTAMACAMFGLTAIFLADMPGVWASPARPNMSMKACYALYDWIGDYDVSTLKRTVNDARQGTDHALARHLVKLLRADQRYDGQVAHPQSAGLRHIAANHVQRDTGQVISDCQTRGN